MGELLPTFTISLPRSTKTSSSISAKWKKSLTVSLSPSRFKSKIVQQKCGLLQPFFQLPASITPVSLVVDWDVLIASWSFNLDREKRSKCVSLLMTTATGFSITVLSSSTLWLQCWSEEDDFQLEKPKLDVQIRGTPQVGQDSFIT